MSKYVIDQRNRYIKNRENTTTLICKTCKKSKDAVDNFYISYQVKTGYSTNCKQCDNSKRIEKIKTNEINLAKIDVDSLKTCNRCEKTKILKDFNSLSTSKDGTTTYCKNCRNEKMKLDRLVRLSKNTQEIDCQRCRLRFTSQDMHTNPSGTKTVCKKCHHEKLEHKHDQHHDIKEKLCSQCEKRLPVDNFYKTFRNVDDLEGMCKTCHNIAIELKEKIKVEEKTCTCCNTSKTISEFQFKKQSKDQHYSKCSRCMGEQKHMYRSRIEGRIIHLLQSARNNSEKRIQKGRNMEGVNISFEHLKQVYDDQQGKCYYSGLSMSLDSNSDWMISIERLDNEKDYIVGNVVLCCVEFNTSNQWTLDKIRQLQHLTKTPVDLIALKENIAKCTSKRLREVDRTRCAQCLVERTRTKSYCANCDSRMRIEFGNTLRGFLLDNLGNVKLRKNRGLCNLNLEFLCQLIMNQNGRCAYSGVPLVFRKKSDWKMSIERIDNTVGYTQNNVCLIAQEFNSSSYFAKNKGEITGSAQWSAQKVAILLQHLNDVVTVI